METKGKKQSFFIKNIYYFVIAFILLAAIAVTVVLIATDDGGGVIGSLDASGTVEKPDDVPDDGGQTPSEDLPSGGATGGTVNGDENNTDVKPTVKVSFVLPVDGATILTDYTATSVVYNKTLNVYTGHLAIDFSAAEGTAVKAVYGGVIESIETSYLTGTTITVNHDGGLKTVYNSIEADESLAAGMKVEQGQTIGTVSDNNKQEYKDGPHLHFEVYENETKISPYKYLSVQEK